MYSLNHATCIPEVADFPMSRNQSFATETVGIQYPEKVRTIHVKQSIQIFDLILLGHTGYSWDGTTLVSRSIDGGWDAWELASALHSAGANADERLAMCVIQEDAEANYVTTTYTPPAWLRYSVYRSHAPNPRPLKSYWYIWFLSCTHTYILEIFPHVEHSRDNIWVRMSEMRAVL